MKIAHVLLGYHPQVGGIGKHVNLLSAELKKRGHEISIFTSTWAPAKYEKKEENIIRLSTFPFKMTPTLFTHLYKTNYDIIHVHGYQTFQPFICSLAKKWNKIPLVFTPQYHPYGRKPKIIRKMFDLFFGNYTLNMADKIIATTPIEKEMLIARGISPEKIEIIPNPIDPMFFTETNQMAVAAFRQRYGLGERVILYVGRLSSTKGLENLITAFNEVKKTYTDVSLLIVGSDPEGLQKHLQKQARYLKLLDIIFTGPLALEDLISAYDSAKVFVLPSNYEATGLVLLEAMARRVPVIATNIGGIPYVIEDGGTGILVPYGNIQLIHEKIITLLSDTNLRDRIVQNARQKVNLFRIGIVADKTEKLYNQLVEK